MKKNRSNIVKISANHLTQGRTRSCGCMLGKESQGQQEIRFLLESNNIHFKQEVTFQDLKLINKLRFDFGIYNDNNELIRLIEFDGEQHYREVLIFKEGLQRIQERDAEKNQ